jgi:hypothetical protein
MLMPKRYRAIASTFLAVLVALAAIDLASSFVAPCSVHYGDAQQQEHDGAYNECPFKGGVVGAGFDAVASFKPEVWTAIATIFIALFTYILYRATNRQAELTREAIAHAESTAKRQLRAYPGITGATIDIIEGQIRIAVVIENFSTTPAYKFRHAISHQFCATDGPVMGFKKTTHKDMQWDMAPHSKTTMRSSESIREGTVLALRMGDLALIFWGRIDYEDAFGTHRYIDFQYRNGRFGERIIEVRGLGGLKEERVIPHCHEPEPIYYDSN